LSAKKNERTDKQRGHKDSWALKQPQDLAEGETVNKGGRERRKKFWAAQTSGPKVGVSLYDWGPWPGPRRRRPLSKKLGHGKRKNWEGP